MPAPLSADLRQRILDASRSLSASKTAARFGVGIRTVQRLRALDRATGSVAPKTPETKGPPPILVDDDRAFFDACLAENVSMTHAEMARRFTSETGRQVGRATVQRMMALWRITRKKEPPRRTARPPRRSGRARRVC